MSDVDRKKYQNVKHKKRGMKNEQQVEEEQRPETN